MTPLQDLTKQQLRNYFENVARKGDEDIMSKIMGELQRRGIRWTRFYYRHFKDNPDTARDVIEGFSAIANSVEGNQRSALAIGGLVFAKPGEKARYWIDVYSAIQCGSVNADFAVHVERPGAAAEFILTENGQQQIFKAEELDRAISRWQEIAARACSAQIIQFPTTASAA